MTDERKPGHPLVGTIGEGAEVEFTFLPRAVISQAIASAAEAALNPALAADAVIDALEAGGFEIRRKG